MNPSVYINWILYSVYGLMAEADELRRRYRRDIDAVADELQHRHPVKACPLYRGVLLDGAAPALRPEPNLTFLSWSTDRDVARWFGSPSSYISAPFREYAPEARGYLLTLPRAKTRVLWHHSWRRAFGVSLESLTLAHPLLGAEAYRQVKWSLDTQHEVITATLAIEALPRPEPVESFDGATVEELDRRLSPPWVGAAS